MGGCGLIKQGFIQGSCRVAGSDGQYNACDVTLKYLNGVPHRLIKTSHISRPEHYFSIYQSGCNLDCRKCHSWNFSRHARGVWYSPDDICGLAEDYSRKITVYEPRERATSFHALDLCRGCGVCVDMDYDEVLSYGELNAQLFPSGERSDFCPCLLDPENITLSPQGFGPARNIIAFTGGDIGCRPDFYAQCSEKIKERGLPLWVLLETNGYGLTPGNLNMLRDSGLDSLWLDIKAFDSGVHQWLTGVDNSWILQLPEEILSRGFVLEVLALYIPGLVEDDQIGKIASLLAAVDENIPFTILAFFPEYRMKDVPPPDIDQMIQAYYAAKENGLKNIRLANLGVFVQNNCDMERLREVAGDAI